MEILQVKINQNSLPIKESRENQNKESFIITIFFPDLLQEKKIVTKITSFPHGGISKKMWCMYNF